MVLAATLGDVLWSLLVIFFMIAYFIILFSVIVDVVRRDASGVKKAAWLVFIFVLPLVGLLSYMIVNGGGMARREAAAAEESQREFDQYVRRVTGDGGPAGQIEQAKRLLDSGTITQDEFDRLKAKALSV